MVLDEEDELCRDDPRTWTRVTSGSVHVREPTRSEVVIGRKCSLSVEGSYVWDVRRRSVGRLVAAGWLVGCTHAYLSVSVCVVCGRSSVPQPVRRQSVNAQKRLRVAEYLLHTLTVSGRFWDRWSDGQKFGLVIDLMDRTNQCRVYRAPRERSGIPAPVL